MIVKCLIKKKNQKFIYKKPNISYIIGSIPAQIRLTQMNVTCTISKPNGTETFFENILNEIPY